MRILFVSTGLGVGGAEIMLVNLVAELVTRGHVVRIVGLKAPGGVTSRLRDAGAQVDELGAWRIAGVFRAMIRLRSIIREFGPDLIQGWMYQGCLAASFAGFESRVPVAWSLHHSNFDPAYNSRGTLASIRLSAWVSSWITPEEIAYCGPGSRDAHHRHGFVKSPASVLPNGVDFEKFRPDVSDRKRIRSDLGVADSSVLIGIFANRVPIKDHPAFFAAASRLAAKHKNISFVCCGSGVSSESKDIANEVNSAGLVGRILLLGRRSDVPSVMNGCDIITLTSRGESFPMALTEAVACGVPVVSTDVGDCAWVVGDRSRLFTPGDVTGLVAILEKLIEAGFAERREIGFWNRERARELFSLNVVVDTFETFAKRAIDEKELGHA